MRTARGEIDALRTQVAAQVRRVRRGRTLRVAMDPAGPDADLATCPYPGLAAYGADDVAVFHGRDDAVESLVARLVDTRLVAVVGASGTGKSSVVRAGLLAALGMGCLPGSASWPQFVPTPADELPKPPPGGPAIVLVDQFEQAWVVQADAVRRAAWFDELLALCDAGHRVVLAIRGDFVAGVRSIPRLRDALAEGTVLLGPMSSAEIRDRRHGPADWVGCPVETGLVELILDDVGDLPTPLPLLLHRPGRDLEGQCRRSSRDRRRISRPAASPVRWLAAPKPCSPI